VPRTDGTKGGRHAFDRVLMFKVLLQATHALSDVRCEYLTKDMLSFMRFLGLGLSDTVPDAGTIWTFREALKTAGELAVPAFGYKNHISIDSRHGLIGGWTATHAAAHDGARLEDVLDATNTASDVWSDTACRSAKNEAMLARCGLVPRIYRKKPQGRPMPERMRQSNASKPMVRCMVEQVFANEKGPMGLVVRSIGIARTRVKIGLVNLAYNVRRFVWLSGRAAPA
jgi:IS5 family transposase